MQDVYKRIGQVAASEATVVKRMAQLDAVRCRVGDNTIDVDVAARVRETPGRAERRMFFERPEEERKQQGDPPRAAWIGIVRRVPSP